MNTNINKVTYIILMLFSLIVFRLTQLHVLDAEELVTSQLNKRSIVKELKTPRGTIKSADGLVLAKSEKIDGKYKRTYPTGGLFAHIVGFSHHNYGRSGAESSLNPYLSIDSNDHLFKRLASNLLNEDLVRDVTLTLDSNMQSKARQLLENRTGAIVVIEVKTGDLLAVYSNPVFDPNNLESDWKKLISSQNSPLLSRATQGLYPPGSMMKIVTAASALKNGISKETTWDGPSYLTVSGGKVRNYRDQSSGKMTLSQAMAKSSNTIFAQVGMELKGRLQDTANRFGFNDRPDVDFAMVKSKIYDIGDMDDLELAWTAVGQGRTLVSPIHMAMILSAIANKGPMPMPNIVKKHQIADKIEIMNRSRTWLRPIDEATAEDVEQMLVSVMQTGTGRVAAIDGVSLAGKTGTAEIKDQRPHSWFGAYGPVEDPKVAVVVLVENGGLGGETAAPIAKEMLKKALNK